MQVVSIPTRFFAELGQKFNRLVQVWKHLRQPPPPKSRFDRRHDY